MLSLEAVLRHPALRGMRCVAGQSGLARNVANVAFLDYEPTQGSYDNFYKDELVLSTMLFAQGQPALAWQAMEGLMRRGVTAIAVKTVFLHEFPPHVCAMAQQTGTALLLYDGVYLEDVIAAVKGMLGQSAAFEKKDKLAARLAREQQPARCERLAQRLLGAAPVQVQCTACALSDHAPAGAWLDEAARWEAASGGAVFRLGGMRVLLCAAGRAGAPPAALRAAATGTSEVLPLACAGRAMEESVRAAQYAQAQGLPHAEYAAMGVQAVRAAARQDWYVQRFCGAWLEALRSYDEKNGTALYETALCYVRCHGDAALAAKHLFQHPNTVRYRMQKAKALLCGEGTEDRAFYEQLYLCTFLHGDL